MHVPRNVWILVLATAASYPCAAEDVLWLGNDHAGDVFQTDSRGRILRVVQGIPVTGIAWDGTNLYFSDQTGTVTRRTADGLTVLDTFSIPSKTGRLTEDMAWDSKRQRLWRADKLDTLVRMTGGGGVDGRFTVDIPDEGFRVFGLAYDSKRDLLYVSILNDVPEDGPIGTVIRKIDPNSGGNAGDLFPRTTEVLCGLAYDSTTDTLWVGTGSDIQNRALDGTLLSSFPRPKPTGELADGLEFIHQAGPAPPTEPLCTIAPRNAYWPFHRPELHLGDNPQYPDHILTVNVSQAGAPINGVEVSLTATKPAFSRAREFPALTSLTVKTDGAGKAAFRYNPPMAEALDRTDFTASGSVGGQTFKCQGSSLVGVGGMTGPFERFRDAQAALARLTRFEDDLQAEYDSFSPEIQDILLRNPGLRGRLEKKMDKYWPLTEKIVEGRVTSLAKAEVNEISRLAKDLRAHAGPGLRESIARLQRKLEQVPVGRAATPAPGRQTRPTPAWRPAAALASRPTLPLSFEANRGQAESGVHYLARGPGWNLYLTPQEAVLLNGSAGAVRMQFVGGNRSPQVAGLEELPGKSHYLIGRDPARWHAGVPHYAKVGYEKIYPGVDLVFHGRNRQLEFDFVLAPRALPGKIRLAFQGVDRLEADGAGGLLLHQGGGTLRLEKPVVYQDIDGVRKAARCRYVLKKGNEVAFEVAAYDPRQPLTIDPVLSYASLVGGGSDEGGVAVAVDAQGNTYLTGSTTSANFPTLAGVQPKLAGGSAYNVDVFVSKLDPTGSALLYSTYIGGTGSELAMGIAVDPAGNAYVTGTTTSSDFPLAQPLQRAFGGGTRGMPADAFVLKLNPAGSALVYSTYLGGAGDDSGKGIAVDAQGNAYVAGSTSSGNFPLAKPLQATNRGGQILRSDAFAAKLNPDGSALLYSTYLGGSADDLANGIAVDRSGNAYVTGVTYSTDFPASGSALQPVKRGAADAFVAKLNPTGSALVYSTYLGGESDDLGMGIALDSAGNAYLTGATGSTDFPLLNAVQPKFGAGDLLGLDAFVAKVDASGSRLIYSTFLGGKGTDIGLAIAVGADGSAYVAGETDSADFPAVNAVQPAGGLNDGFVARLNPAGSALTYSTTIGGSGRDSATGIGLDTAGNAYVIGSTSSADFPVTYGAYQTRGSGGTDVLLVKIAEGTALPKVATVSGASFTAGAEVAPGSIVSGFGSVALAARTEGAVSLPLPETLADTSVKVKDSAGVERLAPLILVAPGQINYIVPEATAAGLAAVNVVRANQTVAAGTLRVEGWAPGLFSANASGRGVAAAWAIRVAADGTQTPQLVYQCGNTPGSCVPAPIDLAGDSVYLTLFGTGIRGRNAGSPLAATVGREEVPVVYAGAQGELIGLDQVNVGPLPRTLIGRGEVEVVVSIDGKKANTVTVGIK